MGLRYVDLDRLRFGYCHSDYLSIFPFPSCLAYLNRSFSFDIFLFIVPFIVCFYFIHLQRGIFMYVDDFARSCPFELCPFPHFDCYHCLFSSGNVDDKEVTSDVKTKD